jgi:hypothetical protein
MTPALTHREQAQERARHARDALLVLIDEASPSPALREAMRYRLEELYNACSLAITTGDETVYPTLMTKVGEKT